MLRMIVIVIVFLAMSANYARSHRIKYNCHGMYATKGFAHIELNRNRNVIFNAHWTWEEDSANHNANCTGVFAKESHSYKYYNVTRNKGCPLDYVRFQNSLEKSKGIISLVSRTGGDTHDNSGYAYAYFYCARS